uniref:FHOD1 N-terminal GTPase-binding domain-containing protein n=1 Tax=Glossina austeni TaxID=7395 RepID=A0A1A9UP71_GLOAU
MDPDELITLRVQYLVDTDPLDCTSMYPIPTRAPTYAFASTMPLATQLGTILRLLGAPQRGVKSPLKFDLLKSNMRIVAKVELSISTVMTLRNLIRTILIYLLTFRPNDFISRVRSHSN